MPLHDLGYRGWEGVKSKMMHRWVVIALTGIRLAFRSTWLSRTLILSWVPAIVVGIFFLLYEQSIANPQLRQAVGGIVAMSGASGQLIEAVQQNPDVARHEVWSSLLLLFFRYPQGVLMLIVVGIISPRLISYDLRNRGYLLYFSRPIQLGGYVLGKSVIIWVFLSLITTLPAIGLYFVGLSLSPEIDVVVVTWDIPLRILCASVVLMIPTSAVALACSALTVETRYAAFSWFAIWILGWVSYFVMFAAERAAMGFPPPRPGRRGEMPDLQSNWELISPFHVLGRVQQYVFGLYPDDRTIIPYVVVLAFVTFVCFGFVIWRMRGRLSA